MTINFNNSLGIDDEESGRIGVLSVAACCIIAFSAAFFTDKVKKHIKLTLLILLLLTAGCFAWMGLLCLKAIPYSRWQLYVSAICKFLSIFIISIVLFKIGFKLGKRWYDG